MVTYEISLSEVLYTRTVYSGLDFLRDLGGLFAAMRALSLALVIICQHRGPAMFVMTEMFATLQQRQQQLNDFHSQGISNQKTITDLEPEKFDVQKRRRPPTLLLAKCDFGR